MITNQPECSECGGACCTPERLEFPVADGLTMSDATADAHGVLDDIGLFGGRPLRVRVNEHGKIVIRTDCPRRGNCDEATRPAPCLSFPLHYFDDDHTDAERDEIRPFCALFRRLEVERA